MITKIGEHSIDLDLLPKSGANILDLGCLGFSIRDYFKGSIHKVINVDIAKLDCDPSEYWQAGISNSDGRCNVQYFGDKQATQIRPGNDLPRLTIESLRVLAKVDKWDYIKMDIEGEEFPILWTTKHPIAKQISVEFHHHCFREIQSKAELDRLLTHLEQFYEIHERNWCEMHGAGFNYWDLLLIAK